MLYRFGTCLFLGCSLILCRTSVGLSAVVPISPIISDPATGDSYQLLSNADWTDSEAAAVALGGHLATIHSQETQNFIFDVFGGYGGAQHLLWIGLYDPTQQIDSSNPAADYVWVDGSPVTYANWDAGEPNNAGGVEFWAAMYYPNYHNPGSWNDWSNRTVDPIGIPFNGVVEFVPEPPAGTLASCAAASLGPLLLFRRVLCRS
jgi:hypothetical protein